MKHLNTDTTRVFFALIKDIQNMQVGVNSYCTFDNDKSFMAVHVEKIDDDEYSIAHYGTDKMNNDLMRDPEMVFRVDGNKVFPIYWRNDYIGIEEFSAKLDNGQWKVNEKLQAEHTEFANQWMMNIMQQQELKL